MNKDKLTLKEKRFVEKTIKYGNGAQAVREVYDLGSKGGSKTKEQYDKTAGTMAVDILKRPRVYKVFSELLEQELGEDEVARLLAEVVRSENLTVRVKGIDLYSKMKALYKQQELGSSMLNRLPFVTETTSEDEEDK